MSNNSGTSNSAARSPIVLLRSFIDVNPFNETLKGADWTIRKSSYGTVEALDPAHSGELTGQICDYFSQAKLLQPLSKMMDCTLLHFAGNIARLSAQLEMNLNWQQLTQGNAGAAMVVNIGSETAHICCPAYAEGTDLQTGEAVLMNLDNGLSYELRKPLGSLTLIEGYYFR